MQFEAALYHAYRAPGHPSSPSLRLFLSCFLIPLLLLLLPMFQRRFFRQRPFTPPRMFVLAPRFGHEHAGRLFENGMGAGKDFDRVQC